MLKTGEVSIRRISHPRYRWRATFILGGQRRQKYFKTKDLAQAFAEEFQKETHELGARDLITPEERNAVLEFRDELKSSGFSVRDALANLTAVTKRLNKTGLTLENAIEVAFERHQLLNQDGDVSTLAEQRLQRMAREGRSQKHIRETRARLRAFSNDFGSRSVASVRTEEISDWLADLKVGQRTRVNYRAALSAMFTEGVRLRLCDSNPVRDAIRPEVPKADEVEILTPEQMEALLRASCELILPAIAIGGFAGLRWDSEIVNALHWDHVDLDRGYIRVPSDTKTGKRLVKIENNLTEWLRPFAKRSGAVIPPNWRKKFLAARKRADITKWPMNGLRHSFGTYWMAKHADLARCSELMGNSPKTIKDHYYEIVYPEEAERFWGIFP